MVMIVSRPCKIDGLLCPFAAQFCGYQRSTTMGSSLKNLRIAFEPQRDCVGGVGGGVEDACFLNASISAPTICHSSPSSKVNEAQWPATSRVMLHWMEILLIQFSWDSPGVITIVLWFIAAAEVWISLMRQSASCRECTWHRLDKSSDCQLEQMQSLGPLCQHHCCDQSAKL